MNNTSISMRFSAAALVLGLTAATVSADVGTAFTYQGSLNVSGSLAEGIYDFDFSLYDSLTSDTQIGSTLPIDDVIVMGGLFSVSLDFGTGAFIGDARWLAIAVGDRNALPLTTLNPLIELSPVPQAIHASSAESANTTLMVSNDSITSSSIIDGTITRTDLADGLRNTLDAADGDPINGVGASRGPDRLPPLRTTVRRHEPTAEEPRPLRV